LNSTACPTQPALSFLNSALKTINNFFNIFFHLINQVIDLRTGERGDGSEGDVFDCGDELEDDDDVDDEVDDELLDGFCSTLMTNPFVFLFLRTNLPAT
jgi:hypothetical protein